MDTDIKKFLAKTIREVVKEEVSQEMNATVLPVFVKMLQDSDSRIDKLSGVMATMSETMSAHIKAFDKNIAQLQKSKEACQENVRTLLDTNSELVKQLDALLQQSQKQLSELESRLQCTETRYQAMLDKYGSLVDKITDMQPMTRRAQGGSSSSVKIDMKH